MTEDEESRRVLYLAYRYTLDRIAKGGECNIYNGNWIDYTKEDLMLMARDALTGKLRRDALEVRAARKFGTESEKNDANN